MVAYIPDAKDIGVLRYSNKIWLIYFLDFKHNDIIHWRFMFAKGFKESYRKKRLSKKY